MTTRPTKKGENYSNYHSIAQRILIGTCNHHLYIVRWYKEFHRRPELKQNSLSYEVAFLACD